MGTLLGILSLASNLASKLIKLRFYVTPTGPESMVP